MVPLVAGALAANAAPVIGKALLGGAGIAGGSSWGNFLGGASDVLGGMSGGSMFGKQSTPESSTAISGSDLHGGAFTVETGGGSMMSILLAAGIGLAMMLFAGRK